MDKTNRREFVNYWHGMDTYTYRFDTGKLYAVFPRIDTPVRLVQYHLHWFFCDFASQRNHACGVEGGKPVL